MSLPSSLPQPARGEGVHGFSVLILVSIHALCLLALYTGVGTRELVACAVLYAVRLFGITAGFHRYFAHRGYQTGRVFQFVLALLGTLAAQKGVLWWAAHHRQHHRATDTAQDPHSPNQHGLWWSHVGWTCSQRNAATRLELIRDFARYPELRWLDRYYFLPPSLLAGALLLAGGLPMLVWGFAISTTLLWHATFSTASLSHLIGSRRYDTRDTSRNHWLLALLTFGEGWHNNHHHHQNTANQGWFWWEIDVSWYLLKLLSWTRLVWGLRTPAHSVKYAFRRASTPAAAPSPPAP